jgi:hypothetical protein
MKVRPRRQTRTDTHSYVTNRRQSIEEEEVTQVFKPEQSAKDLKENLLDYLFSEEFPGQEVDRLMRAKDAPAWLMETGFILIRLAVKPLEPLQLQLDAIEEETQATANDRAQEAANMYWEG